MHGAGGWEGTIYLLIVLFIRVCLCKECSFLHDPFGSLELRERYVSLYYWQLGSMRCDLYNGKSEEVEEYLY